MAKRQALRSTRSGQVFPMNPDMARSDDVEMVYLDADGEVIEPEEVGPAEMEPPTVSGGSDTDDEKDTAGASATASTGTRRKRS